MRGAWQVFRGARASRPSVGASRGDLSLRSKPLAVRTALRAEKPSAGRQRQRPGRAWSAEHCFPRFQVSRSGVALGNEGSATDGWSSGTSPRRSAASRGTTAPGVRITGTSAAGGGRSARAGEVSGRVGGRSGRGGGAAFSARGASGRGPGLSFPKRGASGPKRGASGRERGASGRARGASCVSKPLSNKHLCKMDVFSHFAAHAPRHL